MIGDPNWSRETTSDSCREQRDALIEKQHQRGRVARGLTLPGR